MEDWAVSQMMGTRCCWLTIVSIILSSHCAAAYINTRAPTLYCHNESGNCQRNISIEALRISSAKSAISYFPQRLGLCPFEHPVFYTSDKARPLKGVELKFGDDIYDPKVMCNQTFSYENNEDLKKASISMDYIKQAIALKFNYEWSVDELPVSWCYNTATVGEFCIDHFPVGCYVDKNGKMGDYTACLFFSSVIEGMDQPVEAASYYLYNHFSLTVFYQPLPAQGAKDSLDLTMQAGYIVKVTVQPKSKRRTESGDMVLVKLPSEGDKTPITVPFTYDVTFMVSDKEWSDRWSVFEDKQPSLTIVMSVANSSFLLLMMVGVVVLVVLRTHPRFLKLHLCMKRWDERTLIRQWRVNVDAWKLLKNDVLRRPRHVVKLCAACGTSAQLFCTVLSVLVGLGTGYLVPANPGLLLYWTFWSYTVSGVANGFVSSHMLYYLPNNDPRESTSLSLMSRAFAISWAIQLGLLLWVTGLNLVPMMNNYGINPLHYPTQRVLSNYCSMASPWWSFLGGVMATVVGGALSRCFTSFMPSLHILPAIKTRPSATPSPIPKQSCWLNKYVILLLSGVLPFGALFVSQVCVLNSLFWSGLLISGWAWIAASFMLCCVLAVCSSCYFTYVLLVHQNYRWWSWSLLTGVGTGLYSLLYCIFYLYKKLELTGTDSFLIYHCFSLLVFIIILLIVGPMCLMGTFVFVTRLYHHLEVEETQTVTKDSMDPASGHDESDKTGMDLDKEGWDTMDDSVLLTHAQA